MGNDSPSTDRIAALKVLSAISDEGAYANLEMEAGGHGGFVTEVVYGVLRRRSVLDWMIEKLSSRPVGKITPKLVNNLRMALYQMLFMDTIPIPIATHEAVALSRRFGHEGLAKFTNGVLRKAARTLEAYAATQGSSSSIEPIGSLTTKATHLLRALGYSSKDNSDTSPVYETSLIESHPRWLVEEWVRQWGVEETVELCRANNIPAPLTLRTNSLKVTAEELISLLSSEGIKAVRSDLVPEALNVKGLKKISENRGYLQGFFQVQDEGSMAITHLLGPQPGERILDVCSAPGGKATHCAALMGDKGEVVALDVHKHRLALVDEAALRLGIKSIKTIEADASKLDSMGLGLFDRILVDAPCTGTGVVRRRPDIRWRRTPSDVGPLVELQRSILAAATKVLKPGGVLVYSTCSLLEAENTENIQWLLSSTKDLIVETEPKYLLPHRHGTDGFFMVRLAKSST